MASVPIETSQPAVQLTNHLQLPIDANGKVSIEIVSKKEDDAAKSTFFGQLPMILQ